VQYEDHQPPLYYLLETPVYLLTDGDLLAMRLLSVLLGAGVILVTWATLWHLIPRWWPGMALTGAAFVAFLPQHVSIMASVSNDSLAELLTGSVLLAVTIYLGNDPNGKQRNLHPVILGVLVGLALLTKTTIYFLAGIAGLAVLLRWRHERWPRRELMRQAAFVIIPALLIGGMWWVRNLSVYGGTDFTGLTRHDEVTIGQPRTDDYIDTMYGGSTRVYLENYAKTTFHSFWGQFGWMALPMPPRIYTLCLLFTIFSLIGVGLFFWRHDWPRLMIPPQRDMLIIFTAVVGFVLAAYLIYNLDFIQFQGRYLYPALIPFAFLTSVGLCGWSSLVENEIPALYWVPLTSMIGLAVFALYALDTYIVPNLH
jgi:4-amino-4-deoxy-L-arabinose transferase-like glycosyltransferase